jgi:hypothetical protein
MNALFLKDLADKTHRGLRGRVEGGKSAGGLCYGYRVVKSLSGGTVTTGERAIEPTEAAIVERIFREFVAGVAPKAIARRLNRDGIAGPFGGTWSPSTIHGNSKRGTGTLNNELYIGRLIWNRLRYMKNPDTGKRISRLNPQAAWITKEIPSLRIVSDELWNAAKDRQRVTRRTITGSGNIGFARRPICSQACRSAASAVLGSSWPVATVSHASALVRRAPATIGSRSDETMSRRGF